MEYLKKIKTLSNAGALPHAVILEGDENRYLASRFFAKCAVCDSVNKPCGECADCQKAEKQVHPDIIELFPSGKMMAYSIEEIRRIKEDAFVLPNEARAKVYIFNDVDNISVVSQNALLKILEEPPKSVVFVLNCKSKTHLLETIISRATVIYVGEEEGKDVQDLEEAFEIINLAANCTELELLKKITEYESDKEQRVKMALGLQLALRELYFVKCGAKEDEELENLAERLTINKILTAIEIVEKFRVSNLKNKSVRLILASLCANLKSTLGR